MDVHSPKQRSYNMSQIKSENTRPEMLIRKWLWSHGYRYRLHQKGLPGKPDIVFPGRRKVLFVHGCFWHKHNCRYFKWPETNVTFWKNKITETVERDKKNYEKLKKAGWKYLIIWECEIKDISIIENKIKKFIETDS